MQILQSYVYGQWIEGSGEPRLMHDATTGEAIAGVNTEGLDFARVLTHAREVGGPALRALTFAERGVLLKELSRALHAAREELIELSVKNAGATRGDAKFDIDGATGTLAAYAKWAQELGDVRILADGEGLQLGRTARFWGQHVLVPRRGVAVHINAFNFPTWNMFEKAACALAAGMPVVEKPGTPTALIAWRAAQIVIESGHLPEGAFQFIAGSLGDLLEHMGAQDCLAFTGSSGTAEKLRGHPNLVRHNVRANFEADSLNAFVLAPGVDSSSETFGQFVAMSALEMTQKSGQKCTAVRRIFVPQERVEDVKQELVAALARIRLGDPSEKETRLGPLDSQDQWHDVRAGIERLAAECETVCGGAEPPREPGFFVQPTLFCAKDSRAAIVHSDEVFGPVATIVPYSGAASEAAELVALGGGGLVCSLFATDDDWVEEAVLELAAWHGRIWICTEKVAEQIFSPGMVLPGMIHGGPGRAGGGEELGGLRGVEFYLQRTALQGFKGLIDKRFGPQSRVVEA